MAIYGPLCIISLVFTLAMAILVIPDYVAIALVYGLFMKITALSFLAFSKRILNVQIVPAQG